MNRRAGVTPKTTAEASIGSGATASNVRRKRRPRGAPKRREQQRAIETRQMILDAALSEFAERGFEAASIRNIAMRVGLQHPLITYHYRTKDLLWRAVAENAFAEIRTCGMKARGTRACPLWKTFAQNIRLFFDLPSHIRTFTISCCGKAGPA